MKVFRSPGRSWKYSHTRKYSINLRCVGRASHTMLLLPLTETSKEVVKDVMLEIAVGLYDVLEGATPAGVMELELVVEIVAPEKISWFQLECCARSGATSS